MSLFHSKSRTLFKYSLCGDPTAKRVRKQPTRKGHRRISLFLLCPRSKRYWVGQPVIINFFCSIVTFRKTTTMLFKMLRVERTYQLCTERAIKPRQVFVTKSRLLAAKVGEYFEKLLNSLATGSCSPQELKQLAKVKQTQAQLDHLVALDDIPDWRSDLPSKYSDLEDRHFPLFVTFDQVCGTWTHPRLTYHLTVYDLVMLDA
jgi:hypothetical protein